MNRWQLKSQVRSRVRQEKGVLRKESPLRVALCYPSTYSVGMSSLGYQTIYREIHRHAGATAERAFLPDNLIEYRRSSTPVFSYEGERPLFDFPVLAFSVSYELEITGLLEMLNLCRIPLLRTQRKGIHPLIVAGGPLTNSNPLPLSPFVDLLILGEGEESIHRFLDEAAEMNHAALLSRFCNLPGFYVPGQTRRLPPIAKSADELLPARSQIMTPNTVFSSMFLIEAERGCSRGCTYCVMRRTTNGGMRLVQPEKILSLIPPDAHRVGLVGAAVTDHPKISDIVRKIVDSGREIGISSLRADRLDEEFVEHLARGGYKTLTTASDGCSQRLRDRVERKTTEQHLIRAAELAKKFRLKRLKLYQIVGLPGESYTDIDELIRFSMELGRIIPLSLGISPFVAKKNTPLDGSDFEGIPALESKLSRLRAGLRGKVDIRPSSVRWAWVEYILSQGNEDTGYAALEAWRGGGSFASWRKAIKNHDAHSSMPPADQEAHAVSSNESKPSLATA